MSPSRRLRALALVAALLVLAAVTGAGAQSATTSVTLSAPTSNSDTCDCIRGPVTLHADVTPQPGRTVDQVDFEFAPAGTTQWAPAGSALGPDFTTDVDTAALATGDYDVRAVAIDDTGARTPSAVARDRVVANNATFVGLDDPGDVLHGSVKLTARAEDGGNLPGKVTFERSVAGSQRWTKFATAESEQDDDGFPTGVFTTTLDTTQIPDGNVDLRVEAQDDAGDAFIARPYRGLALDNGDPTGALAPLDGPLTGVVTLSADASDAGSGVAVVRFERTPTGSSSWSPIGSDSRAPYTRKLDTRLLTDGSYDFRAVITDRAGNSFVTDRVANVVVSNPVRGSFDELSIENVVVPAHDVSMLGAVAGSASHETWAYGLTSAPPAVTDGQRLPYTATGSGQLVLLRYTDGGGWQIADVLRRSDGSAYRQVAGATLQVTGQMVGSGDAWVAVSQTGQGTPDVGVFHRAPGGRFLGDDAATAALRPILTGGRGLDGAEMRLGQSADGRAYGILRVPSQPVRQGTIPGPDGSPVPVSERLDFGSLDGDRWTTRTAGLPDDLAPVRGEVIDLAAADPTGVGAGWGALTRSSSVGKRPLLLARFTASGWDYRETGLDAFDLGERFAASPPLSVTPLALRADDGGVWLRATVSPASGNNAIVARYDDGERTVTGAWCGSGLPRSSLGCSEPLDANHPAAVPDRVFGTSDGPVGLALGSQFVDVYSHGDWTSVAAPGFRPGVGKSLFTGPDEGWIVGPNAIGRVTGQPQKSPIASWPQPNQAPLLSVALPPGSSGAVDRSGALAVGLDGTAMHYDSGAGWLVDPTPSRARRVALRSVAFTGPASAVAVGQLGTILRYADGKWSEDPQSVSATQSQLNSVAFRSDGQGWAVGTLGTILHFDGTQWTPEEVPAEDDGTNVSSVTVAGSDVYAVAGGNLITRDGSGTWRRVGAAELPDPAPVRGDLRLVAGLPDGGLVAAGRSVVIVRQRAGGRFENSAQPLEGIVVALSAFRAAGGEVRAFASLAPSVVDADGNDTKDVAGFPPGDGELLRQTADGWQDLTRGQYPGSSAPGDGAVKADPVLAVAASPDGTGAWAVGGYAGTVSAARLGTDAILPARPYAWRTSSISRYDAGGAKESPALSSAPVLLPDDPDTVSFAFFSSTMCKSQCAAVRDAQPDVNLRAAGRQIAAAAAQPGGPSFAMLGGNARGPIVENDWAAGNGAVDFSRFDTDVASFGRVPLFAAYGPRDAVPTLSDPAQPWADAFARSPAPFGSGGARDGIATVSAGGKAGSVNRYYAFDATRNGSTLRVIVLDESAGTLDGSSPGQGDWLDARLADAKAQGVPVVVVSSRPLRAAANGAADDGETIAGKLAVAGVLAVFSPSGSPPAAQVNRRARIPTDATSANQIPEYEGAALGYQQAENNGVLWYSVAVNTTTRALTVDAVPVVDSLALKPTGGLDVARSSTLSFEGVGRRPAGSLATPPNDDSFPGFQSYVGIPATTCSGCIGPSYAFRSSDPSIGDFVVPSGTGSRFPKLDANGHPIPSTTSGLFCAYNTGKTMVSVQSGSLSSALEVKVAAGDIGRPCGTVYRQGVGQVITVPSSTKSSTVQPQSGAAAPAAPPPASPAQTPSASPKIPLPQASPAAPVTPPTATPTPPAATPTPASPTPSPPPLPPVGAPLPLTPGPLPSQASSFFAPLPTAVPPIPPASTPVPPGGATAASQAAARRKEKAQKHASQSAYATQPAGTSGPDWFFPAVGGMSVLVVLLLAGGVRPGPKARPAVARAERPVRRGSRR